MNRYHYRGSSERYGQCFDPHIDPIVENEMKNKTGVYRVYSRSCPN